MTRAEKVALAQKGYDKYKLTRHIYEIEFYTGDTVLHKMTYQGHWTNNTMDRLMEEWLKGVSVCPNWKVKARRTDNFPTLPAMCSNEELDRWLHE